MPSRASVLETMPGKIGKLSSEIFVTWSEPCGCAGGWYDPNDERLTYENAKGYLPWQRKKRRTTKILYKSPLTWLSQL